MHLTRYHDPNEFYRRAATFLEAHEAEHCLMIGVVSNMRAYPHSFPNPPYLAMVEELGEIVAAAFRTPPHSLVLSMMEAAHQDAVLRCIADDVFALYSGDLPIIGGASNVVKAFVDLWSGMTGQRYAVEMGQRIYELTRVNPITGVPGSFRPATLNDRELLVDWMVGFQADAFPSSIPIREEAARIIDNGLSMPDVRGYWIWDDENGKPVSFAGHTGPTPHGIRIGPVYTPPECRRKGYASACVATLSQYQLDHGRDLCFLFTDLANPTSNKIYMDIGYVPVVDYDLYRRVENL